MNGHEDQKKPGMAERLKLYKKPKPGPALPDKEEKIPEPLKLYKKPKPDQPASESLEIKEPLNFLEQLEQEEFRSKYETPRAAPAGNGRAKSPYVVLVALLCLLGAALFYFYYKPPPPEVTGPRDRTTLLPACQKGNGVACGEMALLEYLGQERLEDLPNGTTPNPNNAFVYARLSCARDSAFGCYLMWRLWTGKKSNLLDAASAEETLKKGCSLEGKLLCLLKERFTGKRDIAAADLRKALTDAADGKDPPRYSRNTEEQRLYTHFLATEQ